MLNIRFRYQFAAFLAITIFAIAPLANAVIAQDSALAPTGQVGPAQGASPQEDPVRKFSAETYKALENDDTETRLMKELINTLQSELEVTRRRQIAREDNDHRYYEVLNHLREARLEFHKSPTEQREVLKEQIEIAKQYEAYLKGMVESELSRREELYRSTAFRITAELTLLKFEKAQAKGSLSESSERLDDEERELLLVSELIDNLQAEFEPVQKRVSAGLEPLSVLFEITARLTDAKLKFQQDPDKQRDALNEQLQIAKQNEAEVKQRVEARLCRREELHRSTAFRIKADLALLKFKKAQAQSNLSKSDEQLDDGERELRLVDELIENLQAEIEPVQERVVNGLEPYFFLFELKAKLAETKLEFQQNPDKQRDALNERLQIAKQTEADFKKRVEGEMSRREELYRSTAFRIRAELALLRFEKAQQRPSNQP